jgi:hypothetical protein
VGAVGTTGTHTRNVPVPNGRRRSHAAMRAARDREREIKKKKKHPRSAQHKKKNTNTHTQAARHTHTRAHDALQKHQDTPKHLCTRPRARAHTHPTAADRGRTGDNGGWTFSPSFFWRFKSFFWRFRSRVVHELFKVARRAPSRHCLLRWHSTEVNIIMLQTKHQRPSSNIRVDAFP